jgi:predicted phage-related endonuclease
MSQLEIVATVTELQELRRLQEELEAAIEAAQDKIKAIMGDSEELTAGAFKVTWKAIKTSRLDTTALKKALPDVVERFMKTTTTRRFQVA